MVRWICADAIDDELLIDVRDPSEYADGHVPGAMNIPVEALPERLDVVSNRPVVVMCGGRGRAERAATLLAEMGHSDVAALDGGTLAWAQVTGRPLARA